MSGLHRSQIAVVISESGTDAGVLRQASRRVRWLQAASIQSDARMWLDQVE
jgi:hypothetical protein